MRFSIETNGYLWYDDKSGYSVRGSLVSGNLRRAFLIVAMVSIAIALYYPVTQYLEGKSLDDEMLKLRRMKVEASLYAADSETIPGQNGQSEAPDGTPAGNADRGREMSRSNADVTGRNSNNGVSGGGSSERAGKPDGVTTDRMTKREGNPGAATDRMAESDGTTQGSTDRAAASTGAAVDQEEEPDGVSTDQMSELVEDAEDATGQMFAGSKNAEDTASQTAGTNAVTGSIAGPTLADEPNAQETDHSPSEAPPVSSLETESKDGGIEAEEDAPKRIPVEKKSKPELDATPIPAAEPAPTHAPEPKPTPFVFDESRILPEYKALYEENRDLVGWLKIDGTMVDYPVLQREDEEYYLTRDFYGNNNANGQLILDAQCDPFTPDMHLVISGHDMKSGKMFGTLQKYASERFGRQHPIIEFDSLFWQGRYRLIAAFQTWDYHKRADGFRYNVNIRYRLELMKYLEELDQIKLYDTGVPVEFGDQLITLSTCSTQTDDGRFVVVARRLREGESP